MKAAIVGGGAFKKNLRNILQDKKIVISAAADGIGWTIVKKCLNKGAKVFLCDNNNKSLDNVSSHPLFNKQLFSYEANASKEND